VLRLDAVGRHEVASGSAPLAVVKALYTEPLARAGLTLLDVDRFSLELHNPEATEPAGSGNVPLNNYRTLASLAVMEKLIDRAGIDAFVRARGLPGFSPTQGHIASAIPYLGHARRGLTEGGLTRTMFTGKGSLFLGSAARRAARRPGRAASRASHRGHPRRFQARDRPDPRSRVDRRAAMG
jgi:betaine reductase